MKTAEVALARRAACQHGVVTRAQALEHGVSGATIARRVRSGAWVRLHSSVYRIAGASPSWHATLLAACFAWGPEAVASHASAAALRRLVGFAPGQIEVTVALKRDRGGPGLVHRSALESVDVEVVDAIPVTTVARTLIDVAGTQARDVVEAALDDALYRGLVSRARLRWRLAALAASGRNGVGVLRELLDERSDVVSLPQSRLETMLLRTLREAGLPGPETQHQVCAGSRVVARVDFAYPDVRLAIEADGRRFHSGRADFEHDRERANALAQLGWRLVRVTWPALRNRPQDVIATVAAALEQTQPSVAARLPS